VHASLGTVAVSLLERQKRWEEAVELLRLLLGGNACVGRRGDWWTRLAINLEHLGRTEDALEVRWCWMWFWLGCGVLRCGFVGCVGGWKLAVVGDAMPADCGCMLCVAESPPQKSVHEQQQCADRPTGGHRCVPWLSCSLLRLPWLMRGCVEVTCWACRGDT
jgi:hypothetical protein